MTFRRCNKIYCWLTFFVLMNCYVITGTSSLQTPYVESDDDSSSDDDPQSTGVLRSEQSKISDINSPLVKNVHYIIPKNNDEKIEPRFKANQQGIELPQVVPNGLRNLDNNHRARSFKELLRASDFYFDDSKENFQYRKGHSSKIYSNSFCVKITPLYSEEGACEKELVKVSEHCNSMPYEIFKTTCYEGSDFVQDNALRLDNYLYSISPKTLVFMLKDGSCLRKEYIDSFSKSELKDRSYCNEIKRVVKNIEEGNSDNIVPVQINKGPNVTPTISSHLKEDIPKQNDYIGVEKNPLHQIFEPENPYIQEEKVNNEESEESDISSNKNPNQKIAILPEKILPPQKSIELPQVVTNGLQNLENNHRARSFKELLRGSDFHFDDSKENFQYRKGHSSKIYSNSFCVKITPLYSEEGACEKELVKVSEHCNSMPYEIFKTTCYEGSDFVQDNALRLDNYLYSISPKTLVFMLKDGSCLRKEYSDSYSRSELKDRSYCNEIKRVVKNIEEGNSDNIVPVQINKGPNVTPTISSHLKEDIPKQNDYIGVEKNPLQQIFEPENPYIQEGKGNKEESEESDISSNKNPNQKIAILPEKILPPQKRRPSVMQTFIQKNPLRRLIKRRQKKKDFSIVLVYDRKKKPLDV